MKLIPRILAPLLLLSSPAMAQTAISQLPNGGLMQQTDIVPMVRNGVTMKATPYSWPSTGAILVSNSTSAPSGISPVNGDCIVGVSGNWVAAQCGAVNTVTNSDGSISYTPNTGTGNIVLSLNVGNANVWTAEQTFSGSASSPNYIVTATTLPSSGSGIYGVTSSTPGIYARGQNVMWFDGNNGATNLNWFEAGNNTTGSAPYFGVSSNSYDTNVSVEYYTKGTGSHLFYTGGLAGSQRASVTTTGFQGAIGATTPSTGAFTTLSASSTVSGTGFSSYLASPPAIGGTAPAQGSFTTLSASSTVSGTGFSTYLASPPAIGGTAPAQGSFTSIIPTGSTIPANGIYSPSSNQIGLANNSKLQALFDGPANAANYIGFAGAASGSAPGISFLGTDTNVNGSFNTQAQGVYYFNTGGNTAFYVGQATSGQSYMAVSPNTNSVSTSAQGGTNPTYTIYTVGSGGIQLETDNAATTVASFTRSSSGGDGLNVNAQAAGSGPVLATTSSSTNAPVTLEGKGTGNVILGGHVQSVIGGTTAPTSVTSCGTGSPSVSGTDVRGTITTGTGAPTSCTLNFGTTWGATPVCVVTPSNGYATITARSATAFTMTFNAGLTSGSVYYMCMQ